MLSDYLLSDNRDLFLPAPDANSLISITIGTCKHTKVRSQIIIYPKHNLIKNIYQICTLMSKPKYDNYK